MNQSQKDMATAVMVGIGVTLVGIFAFFALGLQTTANGIAARLQGGASTN
jgi:hypothetical protein